MLFSSTYSFARMDFEKRGKWLNVLPLGVGQYQNYQEKKALMFFAGESVFLSAALTSAFLSEGDRSNEKLQKIELFSFSGFLLLYFWGAWDAFDNYKKADDKILHQMEKKLKISPQVYRGNIGINLAFIF